MQRDPNTLCYLILLYTNAKDIGEKGNNFLSDEKIFNIVVKVDESTF